jgi:hypothetical protein
MTRSVVELKWAHESAFMARSATVGCAIFVLLFQSLLKFSISASFWFYETNNSLCTCLISKKKKNKVAL